MGLCSSSAKVQQSAYLQSASSSSTLPNNDQFTNLRDASETAKENTASLLQVVTPQLERALRFYHADRVASKSPLTLTLDHPLHGKERTSRSAKARNKNLKNSVPKFKDDHMDALVGTQANASLLISGIQRDQPSSNEETSKNELEWEEIADPQGQTYYYCASTGETTWDKPKGFCSAALEVISISGHGFSNCHHISRILQWSHNRSFRLLATLRLQENEIGDAGASVLAEALMSPSCCQIRTLQLGGNRIGDSGCKSFALALREPSLSLRNLYLDRQRKIRIGISGVSAIADSLSREACHLEILSFSGNKSIDCECAEKLGQSILSRAGNLGALRELYLSGTSVSDDGAKALSLCMPFVGTLSLSGCRIRDEGGVALASALKAASKLGKVDFRLKGFDCQGNYFSPSIANKLVESAPPGCMLAVSASSGASQVS